MKLCNSAKKKFALKREKEIEEALERIDVYNQVFLKQVFQKARPFS